MQLFGSGCIRAHDFTSILCRERTTLQVSEAVSPTQEKTATGNLREVAERLASGRAFMSVVSDHGIS
jgi:hypothetical protein